MTLIEIKTAIATYFGKLVGDLTINNQDLALVALNQVRLQAEMVHDFEFSRRLVTVSVNGVTGGSLDAAVVYGTSTQVRVKSVIDVGVFDSDGNLRPAEWTTVADSLNGQREDNPMRVLARYPTDSQAECGPLGQSRFQFSGNSIYKFPKVAEQTYTVGLEVYTFSEDWTGILDVTGTLTPDATGTYYQAGVFNEQPFYVRPDALYLVFWNNSLNKWIIAPPGEDSGLPYWQSASTVIEASYTAQSGAVGTAAVDYNLIGETVVPDPSSVSDIWTTRGSQYLQWAAIVHLNHYYKAFVFRQEGNLPPPQTLADAGLEALKSWDIFRYESFRRQIR
jgi:hypothetical protein